MNKSKAFSWGRWVAAVVIAQCCVLAVVLWSPHGNTVTRNDLINVVSDRQLSVGHRVPYISGIAMDKQYRTVGNDSTPSMIILSTCSCQAPVLSTWIAEAKQNGEKPIVLLIRPATYLNDFVKDHSYGQTVLAVRPEAITTVANTDHFPIAFHISHDGVVLSQQQ